MWIIIKTLVHVGECESAREREAERKEIGDSLAEKRKIKQGAIACSNHSLIPLRSYTYYHFRLAEKGRAL